MKEKGISISFYSMRVLIKRELISSLYGWGVYAAMFIAFWSPLLS